MSTHTPGAPAAPTETDNFSRSGIAIAAAVLLGGTAFMAMTKPAPSAVESYYLENLTDGGQCLDGSAYDPQTDPKPTLKTDKNAADGHEMLVVTPADASKAPLRLILSYNEDANGIAEYVQIPVDDTASQEIMAACE